MIKNTKKNNYQKTHSSPSNPKKGLGKPKTIELLKELYSNEFYAYIKYPQ